MRGLHPTWSPARLKSAMMTTADDLEGIAGPFAEGAGQVDPQVDWYPGVVLDAAGDEIQGEIYDVRPEQLDELDAFEGMEYRRIRAVVKTPYGETFHAWIWEWLMPVDEAQRITGGDWLKEHGV